MTAEQASGSRNPGDLPEQEAGSHLGSRSTELQTNPNTEEIDLGSHEELYRKMQ